MKLYFVLTLSLLISGCSVFKSDSTLSEKRITSFTFKDSYDNVLRALISVMETENLKIKQNEKSGEFTTEIKTIRERDDVLSVLKSIADLPKSPISEYIKATYYLSIKLEQDDNKTKVSLKNYIEAAERGRFNKDIKLESNGGKEKDILAKMLKILKLTE